ncbi:hypothetical protein BS78_05G278600 [Paspalum vaginatum]|nr:hypothetical protein BS78_05G278600 [Paspalum vaginatum]
MEATMQLILVCLAVLPLAAAAHRRVGSAGAMPQPGTVEVTDPDVARRMIVDHAAAFSNHPAVPFAVDLDAGHPKTHSINSAPYGALWRALRSNLTAGVLHASPASRRSAAAPPGRSWPTSSAPSAREAVVVTVRDALYGAAFGAVARMCFGDGVVAERDVRAMRRTLREFFHSDVDAGLLARSRLARLLRWRQALVSRRGGSGGSGTGDIRSYVDSLLDLRVPDGDDGETASGKRRRRPLRDDEMVRLVWEFLGYGTETVVACVEWTLARLVTHLEVQDKLYRELSGGDRREERLQDAPYLRAVILESLRLHPPVPFVLRDVAGPEGAAAAGGCTTTPPPDDDGAPVVRFVFMAEDNGRCRKSWTDPDEFRPERFLVGGEGEDAGAVPGRKEIKMMPFGAGRRHCPGAGLAVIHIGCFVAALVREFHWAPPPTANGGGGVDLAAINALFVKVMASPLRAQISPRMST